MLKSEKIKSKIKYFLMIMIFFNCVSCETKKKEIKHHKLIVTNKESKYIYDFSSLLNPDEKKNLNYLLEKTTFNNINDFEYVFCSVRNEKLNDINIVSKFYFNSLDIGKNDYKNRILIMISVATRDFKIVVGSNVENYISTKELEIINKKIVDFFKKSEFYNGLNFAFSELNKKLSNQPNN